MRYSHFNNHPINNRPSQVKVAVYAEAAPSENQNWYNLQIAVAIGLFALSGWVLAVANTSF